MFFRKRQRGHAAADGEESGFEEFPEKPEINVILRPSLQVFQHECPPDAASSTNHTGERFSSRLPQPAPAQK